jgi:oligosaccharide repeat unit polymerase
MTMLEQPLVRAANKLLARYARMRGREPVLMDPSAAAEWGPKELASGIGRGIDAGLGWAETSIQDSFVGTRLSGAYEAAYRRVPGLPLLGGAASTAVVSRLTTPLIFIVAYIAFLGMSDHGITPFALWSLVASLAAYAAGTRLGGLRLPEVPSAAVYACGALFALALASMPLTGQAGAKAALVPLCVLALSSRVGMFACMGAAIGGYVLFNQGQWSIGLPYLALGIVGTAHNYRSPGLSRLLESNAVPIALFLMCVGAFYWALDIALVGRIPLLTSREGLDPTYTMRSHLLPIGSILLISLMGERASREMTHAKARSLSILALGISLALMAALGYRTQVLITLLGGVIAMLFWNLVSARELIAAGGAIAGLFAVMTVLRTQTTGAHVGVIESISLRTGLTLDIYDMMASLGGWWGFTKGQTYMASVSSFATLMPGLAYSPRRYVAVFAGTTGISMTSTMLGPIALDFGLAGSVIAMLALGWLLSRTRRTIAAVSGKQKGIMVALYALVLGYMLLGIETGLVDYEVIMLFACTLLYTLHIGRVTQYT